MSISVTRFAGVGSTDSSIGDHDWSNANNIVSDNNVNATNASNNKDTTWLVGNDFGFTFSVGDFIEGIEVAVGRFCATGTATDTNLQLQKGSTFVGNDASTGATWSSSEAEFVVGGPTDLWGTTWSVAELNSSGFGFGLAAHGTPTYTMEVDYIKITVYYVPVDAPDEWDETMDGGAIVGGPDLIGLEASGRATLMATFSPSITSAGVLCGGIAAVADSIVITGSLLCGGAGGIGTSSVITGGLLCDGVAPISTSIAITEGLLCSGAATVFCNYVVVPSEAGAICGGTGGGTNTYTMEIAAAGLLGAGNAQRLVIFIPQATTAVVVIFRQPSPRITNNGLGANISSPHYNGLQHWWSGDNSGGLFVYDEIRGVTGTIIGSAPNQNWVADSIRGNNVLALLGSDYIDVSNVMALDNASTATFSAYVQLFDLNQSRSFFSKILGQTGFSIGWDAGSGFCAYVYNGGNDRGFTGIGTYTTGVWYQVTVVYDGSQSTNANKLKIYVNGVQKTLSFVGTIPSTIISNVSNFSIGRGRGNWFGRLDDLRIYNRALSSVEVHEFVREQYANQLRLQQIVAVYTEVEANYGVVISGESILDTTLSGDSSGPLLAGGSATVSFVYSLPIVAQGVVVAGEVTSQVIFIPTGGIVASGGHDLSTNFVTFGGVFGNGYLVLNGIWNEPRLNDSVLGPIVGGIASTDSLSVFSYVSDGMVIEVSGEAGGGLTSAGVTAEGGIVMGGDDNPSVINFTFTRTIDFPWSIRTIIESDVTFTWNIGRLNLFWYRIISKELGPDNCTFDACCQRYVITVHARTVAELCQTLGRRRFKFPILSIERFSRPAENSVLLAEEAIGIDHTCQTFTPVTFCTIPECADFCVDQDLRQTFKAIMTVRISEFLDAIGSGSIYVDGAATTSYTVVIPDFPHITSGGFIVSGATDYEVNSFVGRGGAISGGSASVASTSYSYIGGLWPDVIDEIYSSQSTSIREDTTDQQWMLPERVQFADSLLSQTDISFGKHSSFLVTKQFSITLPGDVNILGLVVHIDRVATQIGIRDTELYLVCGGQFISDNLADTTIDWPLILTEKTYGTDGISGGTEWRDPENNEYLGPLTVDEFNDPTFGVAIRVNARQILPASIAKINYINFEVFYENPNGSIIRIAGDCSSYGPSYHYTSLGKVIPNSSSICKAGMRYISTGLSPSAQSAVTVSGVATLGFYEIGHGGCRCGGESVVTPYIEFMLGGGLLSGIAKVTPYFETGSGGSRASGGSLRSYNLHHTTSGGPVLGSTSFTPEVKLSFITSGSAILGSDVHIRSSVWEFTAVGAIAEVSGAADQRAGDLGTQMQQVGFGLTVLETTASFSGDVDSHDATILSENLSRCGCTNVPLTVELTHNLAINNDLSKFLIRNNYVASRQSKLRYNTVNDSWQSNLHYRGNSAENNSPESWDLTFELACTDVVGGTDIGMSIWKLAIQVYRKNLVTRQSYDTRIIVGLLPTKICGSVGNQLEFDVSYDTQINSAIVKPNATVYQNTLYDNIGLFKNRAWIESPDLKLRISQSGASNPQVRIDLTDPVLSPE